MEVDLSPLPIGRCAKHESNASTGEDDGCKQPRLQHRELISVAAALHLTDVICRRIRIPERRRNYLMPKIGDGGEGSGHALRGLVFSV